MGVISLILFGGGEEMVHSYHRLRKQKLEWTSKQILFSVLSTLPDMCSMNGSFNLPSKQQGIKRCSLGPNYLTSSNRSWLVITRVNNLSLPEHLLLQYFFTGLDKESAHHLNLTYGGSFAHHTATEGREVLNRILDRTSFVCIHQPTPTELEVHQKKVPEIEPEPLESQSLDSTPDPSPKLKLKTPEEEDSLPSEFLWSIEDDLFEDFDNTSNYFYWRRPLVSVTLMDPFEKDYIQKMIQ